MVQNFEKFEIILVDDASTDNTISTIQKFSNQFPNIKFISIPSSTNYFGNKKNAITEGIRHAQYEHLLFTDADCVPASKHWITEMTKGFEAQKSLVLGYGKYKREKSFLNKLIRFETLLTAWQYFSYAIHGIPYMGVGRNMAYTKTLFKKYNGFSSHSHIKSGDDDLFVSQSGNKVNAGLIWNPKSHTISQAKTKWKDWMNQKRRHITTASSYKIIPKLLLSVFYLTQLLFYALSFTLVFYFPLSFLVIFIVLLRFIAYYYTLNPVSKKFNETDLVFFTPILEITLILFQGIFFVSNLIYKPKHW
jgi:glycosyltransferase involved in cell wall biosynthesis